MVPTKPGHSSLVRDAGLAASGVLSIDDLAALHGMSEGALLSALQDPDVRAQVAAEVVRLKASGELAEARAGQLLHKALDSVEATLDREDLSWASVVKIAELLTNVSGIRERRKDRGQTEANNFSIVIHLGSTSHAVSAERPIHMGDAEVVPVLDN